MKNTYKIGWLSRMAIVSKLLFLFNISIALTSMIYSLIGRDYYDLVYADAGTYSGPDENPLFDEDDEFVFMARHLGDKRPDAFPPPLGTEAVNNYD